MDTEYWLQRWQEGRTGWHHNEVMPLLEKHWPVLAIPPPARVLVPLCGKTLDMLWLAQHGLRVLGVDVSPLAVESFLAENHLRARTRADPAGTHYEITNPPGGGIEIINGDLFGIAATVFEGCAAFYDRAATIALPASMRERMANEVYARLPASSQGLLIVLDYPQHEKEGPPFSVDAAEVRRLFESGWDIDQLERRDILASQPQFSEQGVTALHTAVYRLTRRGV